MSRIKVLPQVLVNKIAAGEVIERPASVVKELVENSIDAGATQISVAIEDGGRRLIRVSDDGTGMTADDLRLAVTPHATSKLLEEDDLFRVATMGFRGEALPSIGAVSNLRIVSRPKDMIEGAEIVVCGRELQTAQSAGCRAGTTVEVRDLFFNVPARRKFLRATATEVGHVNEQFSRLALAQRSIGFELNNNGRTTQKLPADTSIRERIAILYSADLANELIAIERNERNLHIEAYVAPPSVSRSTAAWQYIFLNGRYIRDRFIQHAIREAYRGLIEQSRYPVVFLFLSLDPSMVDVNVHPTKMEVRWQDSNLVHSQVLAAMREKFLSTDFTPALRAGGAAPAEPAWRPADEDDPARQQAAAMLKGLAPVTSERSPYYNAPPTNTSSAGYVAGGQPQPSSIGPDVWRELYGRADTSDGAASAEAPSPGSFAAGIPLGRAIQIHNAYLVAEAENGLVIIDQHALHERIMYERLKNQIVDGNLESQRLLLPETMPATPAQLALIQEHAALLRQLGIEAEPFGRDSIAIHAFPAILKNVDAVAFLRDLLDRLADKGEQTHTEDVIHALLDMMACKAAVKAGDPLTPEEIDALIAQKDLVEKSSNCPHGRPTTLRLSISDLEKQFKRK